MYFYFFKYCVFLKQEFSKILQDVEIFQEQLILARLLVGIRKKEGFKDGTDLRNSEFNENN